jgi:hypothetical protein
MKTRGQLFRVCGMNTPPLRSRPGCEGARSAALRWCLLDADVAGCVELWLGAPQPLSGQRRERLEQCRAELDHVLPLLSDPAERLTAHSSTAWL